MKSEWKETTIGDFCPFLYGKGLTESKREAGDVPVYGSNGIVGYHSAPAVRPMGIVVGRKGTVGSIHLSRQPFWPIDTTFYIADSPERDLQFTYYLLLTQNLARLGADSAVPGLNRDAAHSVSIKIPPLPEQKAIAQVLAGFDDKIELNRRMNATLEAMAQTLFRAWFVDFEPVKAKAAGVAPVGLDAETAALFPSELVASTCGLIPQDWEVSTISDVADINAWTLGKADTLDSIFYIEISEVSRGDIGSFAPYTIGDAPSRARRRLRHGDTALSTVRPDRRAYFLSLNPEENLIASTGFAVVSPKSASWSFVHAALTQDEVFNYLGTAADGGAYPAVRPEVIGKWEIVCPSAELLNNFHRICSPLYEQMERNRKQSRTLAQLRDTVLSRLISGQLRVES